MNQTSRGRLHYGFIIVMVCCLIMGVDIGIVFSCAGIFYQPVSSSIGVSVGTFGIYMSVMYVASTLVLPWAGKMMERHSARKLLTACSALMALTLLAMSMFTAVWQFYAAGAVLGFTVAFLLYLSFPTLINRWFRERIGLMIGICSAASGIGGMLFNPLGAWMITNWGWHVAYIVFGLLVLCISTPLTWLLVRDYPADKGLAPFGRAPEGKADLSEGVAYNRSLRMPVFYGVMLFSFLMMAVSTLNLFIPKYVTGLDYTLQQASWAAAAVMAGVTLAKLLLGHINDRNLLAGVLANTLGGALGLLLMTLGHSSLWLIIGGAFLFGWEYAGVTVQTAMLTRHVFGSKSYTRIYALVSLALAAGGAVAAGGWGLLVDVTSFTFIFVTGAVMMGICLILGIWAFASSRAK